MELILASNSPRRKEILKAAGYEFTVIPSAYAENDEKDPVSTATDNAKGKAKDVFSGLKDKTGKIVLGADTVVFFENEILGKPASEEEAVKTLKRLSGKVHSVVTGYALVWENGEKTGYDVSEVTFNELSDELIREYVKSGSPMDKAGSYGLQDGFPIVKRFKGDKNNIIGLPLYKIEKEIKKSILSR